MKAGLPASVQARYTPTQRYEIRVVLYAVALLLVAVPFLYLLLQVLNDGPLTRVDVALTRDLYSIVRPSEGLTLAAKFVSFLGIPVWFWVIIGAGSIYVWRRGHKRLAAFLAVTNILGGIIDTVMKVVVDRPRPAFEDPIVHVMGKSFPSGHTMATTVGYGSLLIVFMPLIPRKWRVPTVVAYFIFCGLMGLSRLSLGVHYLSDVLGGFVLGLAWLAASTAAFSIYRSEQRKKPVDVMEGAEPEMAHSS